MLLDRINHKLTQDLSGKTFSFQRVSRLNEEEQKYIINNVHKDLKTGCYIIYQEVINNYKCLTSCLVCNKDLQFNQIKSKKSYCQLSCQMKSDIIKNKIKSTVKTKYNVSNSFLINSDKTKKKNRELYNVDYYVQSKEFKEKSKNTHLQKYNVENISHLGRQKYKNKGQWINSSLNYEFINDFVEKYFNKNISQREFRNYINQQNMQISHSYKYMAKHNIYIERSESYLETKIKDFLKQKNVDFICNSREIIKPKEIDIFIPELKLGIECNGDYFHSVDRNIKNKNKQITKTDLCESRGIRLLHFWGYEINSKWKLVKYIISCYLEGKVPKWKGDLLPRDYFQVLDFPEYEIEEPKLEKSYQFNVYKTGYLRKRTE